MYCLISTARTVTTATHDYLLAWTGLQDLARQHDVRAWLFRSATEPSRYLEFLEWKQAEVSDHVAIAPALLSGLRELEVFGSGESETWREATT